MLALVVGFVEKVENDLEAFGRCLKLGFEDVGEVFVGELLEV